MGWALRVVLCDKIKPIAFLDYNKEPSKGNETLFQELVNPTTGTFDIFHDPEVVFSGRFLWTIVHIIDDRCLIHQVVSVSACEIPLLLAIRFKTRQCGLILSITQEAAINLFAWRLLISHVDLAYAMNIVLSANADIFHHLGGIDVLVGSLPRHIRHQPGVLQVYCYRRFYGRVVIPV